MKPTFDEVVKKYIRLIYFFARRWAKPLDVDDLVSETFLKAFKNYSKFMFSTDSQLKSWLLTICRNIAINSGKRMEMIQLNDEIEDGLEGANEIDRWLDHENTNQSIESVKKEIHKLNKEEQEIVQLRIYDELSFLEIGSIYEGSEAQAKMRFYRAIKKLKQKML